jgi:putative CocE/NonD family hydrolase
MAHLAIAPVAAQVDSLYGVAASTDVMVPMRDGVRLATDVYRPAREGTPLPGKFPALLLRTPYNKIVRAAAAGDYATAQYFVPRGYVVVMQDVRGRFKSEGRWQLLKDDPNDGFDTAKWIGAQTWSDGNIGTMGSSYEGGTQHALALANAPNVKAMIPMFAMSNIGQHGIRHNGAFELRWFNWVFTLGDGAGNPNPEAATRAASDPSAAAALVAMASHVREYLRGLPLRAGTTPLQFAPDYEKWLVEAMSKGGEDEFWKESGVNVVDHAREYKDIPVYHMTSWYDSWDLPVADQNYPALRKSKKSLQRLIVGPWMHSSPTLSFAGEAQFSSEAGLDWNSMQLRWFDHWLKGIDNGVEREAPVRIYVMGGGDAHKTPEGRIFVGGHWRDEQEWPLARTTPTAFYLQPGGVLSSDEPKDRVPPVTPPVTWTFDPRNPVPTLGGNISSFGALIPMGPMFQRCRATYWLCSDEKPLSSRNDILVFQTPPLANDVEVTGRLIVKLWAASDGPDTDFTAKLIDVYPPNADFPGGFDLNIGDSIVRARYRNELSKAEFLTPGQPYEFTIEMYPTSVLYKRGHRIRLDISSSNFPRFDVNPNTGEPLNDNRRWRIAENTVFMDAKHPSHILLPIIPAS